MRPLVSSLVLLAPACTLTLPNPAYEPDTEVQPVTTDGPPTTTPDTTPPTTTEPPGPDTLTGTTLDDATTGPAMTVPVTGTDPDSTTSPEPTTSTTDTDSESDTDSTADCWSLGPGGWPLEGAPLTQFSAVDVIDPFISADGKAIFYIGQSERRPHVSERQELDDMFLDGKQLTVWGDLLIEPAHPILRPDRKEMIMGADWDIYYSVYNGEIPDEYSDPALLGGTSTDQQESNPTGTADGALLIVQRADGQPLAPLIDRLWSFHQFTRADVAPGAPFTTDVVVTPPLPPLGLAFCPALAPDGLHLFFSSTAAMSLDLTNVNSAIALYYTRRAGPDQPWDPPAPLTGLADGKGIICAVAVTANGCTMTYSRNMYARDDTYEIFLAERAAP